MSNIEFERLVENRKDWVRSSKENKFDFDSILAGLYNDPSHFIYEILQNAEDEGAKKIRFELFEDRLDVYHNGKDFDLEDIDGVTGIGISKKKDDLTAIGKFGVGFKSVFAVTETPYIFSGDYNIKIEDFVIPSLVSSQRTEDTLIRLPFNHKMRTKKEIFTLVSKKLENIGLKVMLFLKNIEEIQWRSLSSSGHYLKSSESFKTRANVKKITIISSNTLEQYIVVGKPIKIEGKDLKIEVAYKLGKDKNSKQMIIPEPDSKLVVYFPTEKVTYLNFIIQGPYKTTPNRENVPLNDKQNKAILEETANLVAESLLVIKDLGYLNTNFLDLLTINPENKEKELIYSVIYDKVKEKFFTHELLPTSNSKYTKANLALLARGRELTEFLDNNDIQTLFSKKCWLDTNITYDKSRVLRDYLINELGITEVDFESFARKITVEFLHEKSDDWMIDFYSRLLEQQSLWSNIGYKGILRNKPIIRLGNNEHIAPVDDNGKVQVYLPLEGKTQYKTVKKILTENENSLKFLEALGLIKPDLFAEIREFILPKYQKENPEKNEDYFGDIEKLLKAYDVIQANKKKEFIGGLSEASFIFSVKNGTGEADLRKPTETYFSDSDLRDYFHDFNSVYFIADVLCEKFGKERLESFFIDLGVENKPRRIKINGDLSWEERKSLIGNNGHSFDTYQEDYEYEGLENFLKEITIDKSYLLWKLLLKNIENLSSWEAENFFKGKYGWFYYSAHSRSFDAKFIKTLRQLAWLVDKNNNFRKSSDISFAELSDRYIKNSPNIDVLLKILEFKPGIIDQLPENDRKILEITREKGITPENLIKLIAESKIKLSEEKEKPWIPECEPDEVTGRVREEEPSKIITPDLSGQGEEKETISDEIPTNKDEELEKDSRKLSLDRKAIGDWGEKHVFKVLKEKYSEQGDIIKTDYGFTVINTINEKYEIVWLNKYQNRGKGYDFIIKKNGIDMEYIEVKAKTKEGGELVEVTGTQWEFARKLFDQNEGDKYFFYVVLDAGTKNAEVHIRKNPIKLWKEGKLYAHPVNFKL